MNIDFQKIQELIAAGKKDEAQALVSAAIEAPLSQDEKGELLLALTTAYLDVTNAVQEDYKTFLSDTLAALKQVSKVEGKIADQQKIATVRKSLS